MADGSFPADLNEITDPAQYATLLKAAGPGPYYQDSVSNYAGGLVNWFNQDIANPAMNLLNSISQQTGISPALVAIGIVAIIYTLMK